MKRKIVIFNIVIFSILMASISIAMEEKGNNKDKFPGCFTFSDGTTVTYGQGKMIDLSKLIIDLSEMNIGGIGRCADASQLMASGMKVLGCGNGVYNIPYSVNAAIYPSFESKSVVSVEGKNVDGSNVTNEFKEGVRKGFVYFNLPLDVNNHASLVTVIISNSKAKLVFYDSLSNQINSYDDRYCSSLCDFIKSLLPDEIEMSKDRKVLHLLDQGGENSAGCGYYTIYTALLLKDEPNFRKKDKNDEILFDENHDQRIKALLAVITMLEYGVENLNVTRNTRSIKNIFEKLGPTSVKKLASSLHNRINEDK